MLKHAAQVDSNVVFPQRPPKVDPLKQAERDFDKLTDALRRAPDQWFHISDGDLTRPQMNHLKEAFVEFEFRFRRKEGVNPKSQKTADMDGYACFRGAQWWADKAPERKRQVEHAAMMREKAKGYTQPSVTPAAVSNLIAQHTHR